MTITRRHVTKTGWREAVYSDCEAYRYSLTVAQHAKSKRLAYIMLNPSRATERANDPTIERCERRADRLGYGAFRVVNLFALRETSPERLRAADNPEGAENLAHVAEAAEWADAILAAWGVHGAHRGMGETVLPLLRASGKPVLHLGLTKHGHPRHPLYISYKISPTAWA